MSAAAVGQGWDALLRTWRELDVPEGWRAEIIEGGIVVMTPPPGRGHNLIADVLHPAVKTAVPREWAVLQTLGVSVPGLCRIYEPDLVVVPRAVVSAGADSEPVPAEEAKLAVEIVSKNNARTDRVEKLRAYAVAGIPLYLLIDRFADEGPWVTLFSKPVDGHYRHTDGVPFGGKITIPEPVGLVLDTKEFD
ncbi:Uma2 family endonuclease [Amycolatopsis sp. NPDC058986]|uniref:Uma2 family endonuclease n=1 Tax=unclassified Amycolatopsis TaxID=2618356 RepID=UPI00366AC38D